jgi:hypothetical protein
MYNNKILFCPRFSRKIEFLISGAGNPMKSKNRGLILSIIIMTSCILITLLMLVFVWMQYSPSIINKPLNFLAPPPIVDIVQPDDGTVIYLGEGLLLGATAFSNSGLDRLELLVDGQVVQQFTPKVKGEQTILAVFSWFAGNTGWHKLSIVAFDLQGRASTPAVVVIGVQVSAGLPGIVMQPSNDLDPDPVGEAVPPVDNNDPGVDNPDQPQGDLALPELPPQPQDAPPLIQRFNVFVDLFIPEGGQPVATATATVVGSAIDDLGMQSLKINWHSNSGDAGDFSKVCAGGFSCEIEMEADLDLGEWVFSLQAFDTSGQVSPPVIQVVEVLGNEGQPPAIVEHGFDEDWFRDHLQDNQPDLQIEAPDLPGNMGFDIEEFLVSLFPNRRPEPVEAEGHCVSMSIEPRWNGNLVSMQIECDLEIEGEGMFILPYVEKHLINTGDQGIRLFIPDWKDNTRTILASGDTFTWLDQDVTCGTDYLYKVRVDSASNTNIGLAFGENYGFAQAETSSLTCAPGSIGDINLLAEAANDGVRIRWNLARNGNWPDDLPPEGVMFILTRFDTVSKESQEFYNQNIPVAQLLAGGEFEAFDNHLQCGSKVIYTLAAISADANFDLVSPGWLLRSHVNGLDIPCPADSIGSIELNITPYWINESFVRMRLQTLLPAGFNWQQGQQVEVEIQRIRQGFNGCEAPPCR